VVASKACDSANSGASMVRIKETMGAGLEKRRPYMLAKNQIKSNQIMEYHLLQYFYVSFEFNLYKWCEIYSYFVR
jgi:hypothetical protein